MFRKSLILFLFFSFFLHSPFVFSNSVKKLERELDDLKEISLAQSQNLAKALNQVQEVVSEFQQIHGQIGSHDYFIKTLQKSNEDLLRRLEISETKVEILTKQLEDIKKAGLLKTSSAQDQKEFTEIEKGLTYLNTNDFRTAASHLEKFINENPKSKYLDIAKYWTAESHFAMGDYAKSVGSFQKVISDHPKSHKAPSSVLKQGLAFFRRQSLVESKAFLSKVLSDYPESREAIIAKSTIAQIEKLKAQRELEALMNETNKLDSDTKEFN